VQTVIQSWNPPTQVSRSNPSAAPSAEVPSIWRKHLGEEQQLCIHWNTYEQEQNRTEAAKSIVCWLTSECQQEALGSCQWQKENTKAGWLEEGFSHMAAFRLLPRQIFQWQIWKLYHYFQFRKNKDEMNLDSAWRRKLASK
jgi:hypothetical protein